MSSIVIILVGELDYRHLTTLVLNGAAYERHKVNRWGSCCGIGGREKGRGKKGGGRMSGRREGGEGGDNSHQRSKRAKPNEGEKEGRSWKRFVELRYT